MIRYSHVSLLILCNAKTDGDLITAHLGIQPTRIREEETRIASKDGRLEKNISYTWMLDSPRSAEEANPTNRLLALANVIEPFGERISSLDSKLKRFVNIVYHVTPQHPHGITGEFDWLQMPAAVMRPFVNLNLDVSYETIWFDHPDWVSPVRQGRLKQIFRRLWK